MNKATGTTAPTGKSAAPGEVTGGRDGILQAAVELIARDGFDGVRIADIAAHAKVSTALVHYHFTGRDRLLTDALTYSLTRAEARLEGRTQSSDREAAGRTPRRPHRLRTSAHPRRRPRMPPVERAGDPLHRVRRTHRRPRRTTPPRPGPTHRRHRRRPGPRRLPPLRPPRRGHHRHGPPRRPDQPAPHRPRFPVARRRPPPGRTPARARSRLSRHPPLPAPPQPRPATAPAPAQPGDPPPPPRTASPLTSDEHLSTPPTAHARPTTCGASPLPLQQPPSSPTAPQAQSRAAENRASRPGRPQGFGGPLGVVAWP